jgi:hypothetical protein
MYCTPGELCERWNIDARTLRKLPLSWITLEPTNVRRVRLNDVEDYEQQQRLGRYAQASS